MTTPSAYCTEGDLYKSGLPRGGLPNPGRLISAINATTNLFTLDGHGFVADDVLVFRAEDGGSMPSPLVAGTSYYAKPVTDSTFQVAAAGGGAAIDLSTAGASVVVTIDLDLDAAIEWASALIEDFVPAHLVPLSAPYPTIVIATTADLAVARLLAGTAQAQAQIADKIAAAQKLLERWAKSYPIRGANAPASANLAQGSSEAGSDPRGYFRAGGGIP